MQAYHFNNKFHFSVCVSLATSDQIIFKLNSINVCFVSGSKWVKKYLKDRSRCRQICWKEFNLYSRRHSSHTHALLIRKNTFVRFVFHVFFFQLSHSAVTSYVFHYYNPWFSPFNTKSCHLHNIHIIRNLTPNCNCKCSVFCVPCKLLICTESTHISIKDTYIFATHLSHKLLTTYVQHTLFLCESFT